MSQNHKKKRSKVRMRPGFNDWAEEQSSEWRAKLGLTVHEACPARKLAHQLDVLLVPSNEVAPTLTPERYKQFADYLGQAPEEAVAPLSKDGHGYFGMHILIGRYRMVFFNPSCAPERQESDIMHELAHVLCGHEGQAVSLGGLFALRMVDDRQEAEADKLGSVLQIHKDGIFRCVLDNWTHDQIAKQFRCSVEMVKWRMTTSAAKQRVAGYRRKRGW